MEPRKHVETNTGGAFSDKNQSISEPAYCTFLKKKVIPQEESHSSTATTSSSLLNSATGNSSEDCIVSATVQPRVPGNNRPLRSRVKTPILDELTNKLNN